MSDLASLRERLVEIDDRASLDLLDAHLAAVAETADDSRVEQALAIARGSTRDPRAAGPHMSWPLIGELLAREVDRLRVRVTEPDPATLRGSNPDPVARVRLALRERVVPHPDDVRALLGAHDSRGRQLDAVTGDLGTARELARMHAQREAEYVDRLADKVPAVAGPLPDQPGALDELRRLLSAEVLATRDTRHARALADELAVEWGHMIGLRRRWQRAHNDHAQALMALPENVRGYPGEPPTSLADRVTALRGYYDMCRAGWGRCHHRHLDVEAAAREVVLARADDLDDEHPIVVTAVALADVLRRHRATDGDHIPADHASRSMSRHVEIVTAVRKLLHTLDTTTRPAQPAIDDAAAVVRGVLDGAPVDDTGPGVHAVRT